MQLTGTGLRCERGGRTVFRDCSFALKAGELMQLTGPNGSGKSSLLRLMAGLNEAGAGTLTLEGGHAELSIGQQSHYVAHQDAIKPVLTVAENLEFWRSVLGGGDVVRALAVLDLSRLAPYPAGLLSAGQKRRLALARVALVPRALWLLDEPTTGLDKNSRLLLCRLMQAQLDHSGMIIAATHVPLGIEAQRQLDLGQPS
jgi:heme exporter protein A